MGLIDKKKLIEMFLSEGWSGRVVQIVENFPEEPGIDFDHLWKEYKDYCRKREVKCGTCGLNTEDNGGETCFTNFLKSKHLSAQKQKQLPMKKVWTLKKEYEDFVFACGIPNVTIKYCCGEPEHKEFYDLTETPDYSAVKVGDVVEIDNFEDVGIVVKNVNGFISLVCHKDVGQDKFVVNTRSNIKSLTILKAAE